MSSDAKKSSAVATPDPGRAWRRIVRFTIVGRLVSFLIWWKVMGMAPLDVIQHYRWMATGEYHPDLASQLYAVSACFYLPLFAVSPLFLLVASPARTVDGWRKTALLGGSLLLWGLTLLGPYLCVAQLIISITRNDDSIPGILALSSIWLLLGFLAFLRAWRFRRLPQCAFWLELYSIGALFFSTLLLIPAYATDYPMKLRFYVIPAAELLLAILLTGSWLMWWRAVTNWERRAQIEQGQSRNLERISDASADTAR